MMFAIFRRIGLLMAPDLALAVAFGLAWWTPLAPGTPPPAECRLIMLLEGLSIIAAALVGIYLEVAFIALPLIVIGCVVWFAKAGLAGLAPVTFCFVWYVASAFVDGLLARRGRFGSARENPAHPHRRYDRMFFLYLMTAPIPAALWFAGHPLCWAVWGTIYFALLTAVDTVLRRPFDWIPQALLRGMKSRAGPEAAAKLGICKDCVHVQPAIPARPGRLIRCGLSGSDPRFPEHPHTPVQSCEGFRKPVVK